MRRHFVTAWGDEEGFKKEFVTKCYRKGTINLIIQQTLEEMEVLYKAYHFAAIGWENVVFSGIYGKYIQKLGIEKGLYFPIQLIGVGSTPKEMRIRSYSMLVQNGFIRFPTKGCENIITQLTEFPMGAFDDLCDGLYLAIKAAEKGSSGNVAVSTKKTSRVRTVARNIIARARG